MSFGRGLSTPSATSRGEMGVTGSEIGAATMSKEKNGGLGAVLLNREKDGEENVETKEGIGFI